MQYCCVFTFVFLCLRILILMFIFQKLEGYHYDCDLLPLFELGSVHHDYYLVNLRLPTDPSGLNDGIGHIDDIWMVVSIISFIFSIESLIDTCYLMSNQIFLKYGSFFLRQFEMKLKPIICTFKSRKGIIIVILELYLAIKVKNFQYTAQCRQQMKTVFN